MHTLVVSRVCANLAHNFAAANSNSYMNSHFRFFILLLNLQYGRNLVAIVLGIGFLIHLHMLLLV